ncbi:molybdopterin-dependent oxidoreductase [Bacillus salinus]|uniref:molybdopterin-dependent oxidoreductase n=1 Tax=Bacillus sp. HMF5848 TaxID=2495421 RepID=UPI00289C2C13|nr:molybdopterin-dependent oxidoreductase [Bacillus sp. HMF5848]
MALSTISKYADIVLPATTEWEKEGTVRGGNPETMFVVNQVVDPIFEARTEEWMDRELAKRLGLNPDEIYPISAKQQFFNRLAGAKVITKDGKDYETLVTITQKDIKNGVLKEHHKKERLA